MTIWARWNGTSLRPNWDEVVGTEVSRANPLANPLAQLMFSFLSPKLYDHTDDDGMAPAAFDDFENVNLAGSSEHAAQQEMMEALLKATVEKYITPWPI